MKFTKLLKSRKSIRTYTGKPADKKQVKKIIEAAELAPVARGLYENYQLTIINDPKLLKEIDQEAAMMFGDLESHPLYGVPTLFCLCQEAGRDGLCQCRDYCPQHGSGC